MDNNNGVGEHQYAQLRGAFAYTRQMAIAGVSPGTFNLDDDDRPIEMAGGRSHRIILTQSGQVFTATTNNDHGQLGIGNTSNDGGIYNITSRFDGKVVSVSAGGNYSLALTDSGRVYSWGLITALNLAMATKVNVVTPMLVSKTRIRRWL